VDVVRRGTDLFLGAGGVALITKRSLRGGETQTKNQGGPNCKKIIGKGGSILFRKGVTTKRTMLGCQEREKKVSQKTHHLDRDVIFSNRKGSIHEQYSIPDGRVIIPLRGLSSSSPVRVLGLWEPLFTLVPSF